MRYEYRPFDVIRPQINRNKHVAMEVAELLEFIKHIGLHIEIRDHVKWHVDTVSI